MSIYHPPLKTQSVFNPSNFGGLGAGGQITIDYLKSSFLEFPVAQGNTTLVGTSVLGNMIFWIKKPERNQTIMACNGSTTLLNLFCSDLVLFFSSAGIPPSSCT